MDLQHSHRLELVFCDDASKQNWLNVLIDVVW